MTVPARQNPFPREILAAYADGELDTRARAEVKRWLAEHPDARAELDAQQELSPANVPFWESVELAEPASAVWTELFHGVERQLFPAAVELAPVQPTRHARFWVVAGIFATGIAAAVAWVAFTLSGPAVRPGDQPPTELAREAPLPRPPERSPPPREAAPERSEHVAALPMANDDDVVLDRVPDTAGGWLPVGRHPLAGFVVLATVEDVHLEEVAPSPAWPPGGPKMTTSPGDTPMIFAAKPR